MQQQQLNTYGETIGLELVCSKLAHPKEARHPKGGCARAHMYTHRACMSVQHPRGRSRARARTHTHTPRIRARAHMDMHMRAHTHAHACAHACMHTHTPTHARTHARTRMHTLACACDTCIPRAHVRITCVCRCRPLMQSRTHKSSCLTSCHRRPHFASHRHPLPRPSARCSE